MGFTVKVGNVSEKATERDIYDFFAFSGEISSIQVKPSGPESPGTQQAFVTFQEERSLETALLLTGAVIADRPVTVELVEGYVPPATSSASAFAADAATDKSSAADGGGDGGLKKAEEMMAGLLARGYVLSKDAVEKARAFDEKHALSASVTRSAADLDSRFAISKKLAETTAAVSSSWQAVDDKYHVSSRTKDALTTAEASLAEAGHRVMQNKYVSSGASWLFGALGELKTMATQVQQQTLQKVQQSDGLRAGGHATEEPPLAGDERGSQSHGPATSTSLFDHGPPVAPDPAAPDASLGFNSSAAGTNPGVPRGNSFKSGLSSGGPPVF